MRRAEIDTRAPFRSVKEAVSLFGEKVLCGEIYANKLKEVQKIHGDPIANEGSNSNSKLGTVAAELEETKQNLQKAVEDSKEMANCLSSLQQELEKTKQELRQLKIRESEKQVFEFQINEDIKIVEDSTNNNVQAKKTTHDDFDYKLDGMEFQKKRYVTFANPPSLAHVIVPSPQGVERLQRHSSLREKSTATKKKKKPLIPLIGGIFSRKKVSREIA